MSTLTPNYGLIVPEATDSVAQVRADYATNLGLIDNISGGGGGGGGNVYGAFVNTNRIIASGTYTSANPLSYTATEDCYIYSAVSLQPSTGGSVRIDGELVGNWYNGGALSAYNFEYYLRRGQTLTATQTYSGTTDYVVYGLIQGTESIFTPIIYSDSERLIGIWRDNKPLYQRSFPFTVNISGGQTATIATLSGVENIIHASGWLNGNNIIYFLNDYSARIKINASGDLQLTSATGSSWNGSGYITLQYTKTADVAGSGNWNTDGVPTVHYSTSEQVIGTWIDGKTLYKISCEYHGNINANTATNLVNIASLNVESMPTLGGSVYEAGWGWEQIPTNAFRLHYNEVSGYIEAVTGSFAVSGDCYITLTYTKTTD